MLKSMHNENMCRDWEERAIAHTCMKEDFLHGGLNPNKLVQ